MIDVNHLCFSFGSTPILKNLSFQVDKGEFVALFGPNGGGKTTLCKLLVGLLKPTSGIIKISGPIAYVPQHFAPDPFFPLSVLEVVIMGRLFSAPRFGGYGKEDKKRSLEALREVGLFDRRHAPFSSLSGGQKQRVLVARAFVSNPSILILDEATANVDHSTRTHLLSLIKNKGLTILMVTHDLKSACEYSDRLFCVQGSITPMQTSELCHHFESGLYHEVSR